MFKCVIPPNLFSLSQIFSEETLTYSFSLENREQFFLVTAVDSLFQIVIIYDSSRLSTLQQRKKEKKIGCLLSLMPHCVFGIEQQQGGWQTFFSFLLLFYQGVQGTNITIKVLCSVMADASLGQPYARYAAVARLMMDTFSLKCLDASFSNYLKDMTNTSWDGPAAGGGVCACVLGSGASVRAFERERRRLWLFDHFLF